MQANLDHFLQLFVVVLVFWSLKGICSDQHDIQHHPTRPDVSNLHQQAAIRQTAAV